MLNIFRRDHAGSKTHCWRVEIRRQSRTYRRSFSDGRYGGREHALQAARAYRDQVVAAHPPLARPTISDQRPLHTWCISAVRLGCTPVIRVPPPSMRLHRSGHSMPCHRCHSLMFARYEGHRSQARQCRSLLAFERAVLHRNNAVTAEEVDA